MTHGYIYLPFRRTNQLLFCEAWSDGDIDYVGLGVLNSSGHIHEVADISTLFVGSPFFYYPERKKYFAKEKDNMIDTYSELMIHPHVSYINGKTQISFDQKTQNDYQDILNSAQESLDFVLEGKIEEAFKNKFGKMTFEEKLALNMGINTQVVDPIEQWDSFISDSILLPQEELFSFLINELKQIDNPKEDNLEDYEAEALHSYFWKDDQFWSHLYINEQEYVSPLVINCALFCNTDEGYVKHITEKDKETLEAFKAKLVENNMSLSLLFKGNVSV